MESSVSAIVVAAGSSRRMGFDKLEADLAGRSVLAWSLAAFETCAAVSEIRVVAGAGKFGRVAAMVEEEGIGKFVECVEGGAERHLSVRNGLERVGESPGLVAVHDGARPLVTPGAIERCARVAREHGAAALAHRVADTLKRADAEGIVRGAVDREGLWAMETPQVFRTELLRAAYRRVLEAGEAVTDEVSAVQARGTEVRLVENREPNPKITVPGDLLVAEGILRSRDNHR